MMNRKEIGMLVLRLGLAALFLWFGFSELVDTLKWVSWVPTWAVNLFHLSPAMIVLLNGVVEVIGGSLLALDLFVPVVAFVLGLHLLIIVIDIGLDAVGVRDAAIMFATFALMFLSEKPKTQQNPS
jgi:uncharacterized membrane protein YphA (DoxX/SURF4 family)